MKLPLTISLILIATCLNAQSPFKVGPYAKDAKVFGVKNVVYIAKVAMKKATVMPSKENVYWGLYKSVASVETLQFENDSLRKVIAVMKMPTEIQEAQYNTETNILTLTFKKN